MVYRLCYLFLHSWCHMKLLLSRRKIRVHHTTMHHTARLQCHFIQSHIGRVRACLAVTCHLHFSNTSQHSTTRRSDGKFVKKKVGGLELSAESSVPPVNTVSNLVFYALSTVNRVPHGNRRKVCEERGRNLELSAEPSIPPVYTVPHGGQMENL